MSSDSLILSQQGCSHHETNYGSYTNQGYHASEGGVINHYQVNLSNALELENHDHTHEHTLHQQPKRQMTNPAPCPSRSKRQRVGDYLTITLDIAKESADFGNPLKATLAGISSLIGHYEEFESIKYKIEGLQSQLDRLKQGIVPTTIDGDPEATRRRTEFISVLGGIEKRSQELLEKGKDSEEASLVEQFREAITCYQISQQQAIRDRITDLTSSFNTVLKLQEKSPAVKKKLDSVIARLDQLCLVEDSDDDKEHERWAKLFNTLRVIRNNGNMLYNRINSQDYEECEDDIRTASGIAEDIRNALLEYQMSQQRAIYDQNCKLIDDADLSVLNNCRRARGAAYQHGNRRGCLRDTREVILNEIELWTKDFNKSPVFWLNGLAGTGKSTIAQTIADRAFADGLLGASFFCSRDFEDRGDLHCIFPTLAFQLAHNFSSFRGHLVSLLRANPDIVDESLYNQMERLIVEPLRSAEISTVIVVDALDECKDEEPSSAILSVLGRLVEQIPRVKFFITGRPEPRIKSGFRLPLLEDATKVFVLHDVPPDSINSDIRLFLHHELTELARRHQLERWPSDEHITLLCQRAAGLFVYAVATVKFLDSKTHLPEQRLDVIVKLPDCTTHEGKTQFKPRTTLDSLYLSVLQMAFSEEDPEVFSTVQSVIGAVVLLVNPLPPSGIAELTSLEPRQVILLLTSVQSLLIYDEDLTKPVKSFHKSFPDFMTNPIRCTDTRFYISPGNLHLDLAMNCLRVLNNGLVQNLLDLPDFALNSEVKDLQTRIDGRISTALRYACQSWHSHLIMCRGDVADVISRLRLFLEEKFLAWLEVLSVLKATRGAVVALEKLMPWLEEVSRDDQLLHMSRDCFYFVTEFFEPINVSAAHIYHSALELSPLSSMIRKLHYSRRLTPFPRVESGIPHSRDPGITIYGSFISSTWSPCGQFVAVRDGDAVKIRDALTFELVSTLQSVTHRFGVDSPSYSPDGHSLACISSTDIRIWDVQTGGVAKRIECDLGNRPLVWSSDGRVVGVVSYSLWQTAVNTYDIDSGMALSCIRLESGGKSYLWAHNSNHESFRFMTTAWDNKATTIVIFEVWPAVTKLESFPIHVKERTLDFISSFSQTTYRISLEHSMRLVILDVRNSKKLLVEDRSFSNSDFSSDGSRFAASSSDSIHIWNYDGGRYIPWRRFPFPSKSHVHGILFSPTSSLVLVSFSESLRIWRLASPPIPSVTRSAQLDISSRSGTPATALSPGSTITITKRLSQFSSQFINTGFQIAGLGLTGNVLLAKGRGSVAAWLLEEGRVRNVLDNRRAGRDDRIWTLSSPVRSHVEFSVGGETVVIKCGTALHCYNSRTGDVLQRSQGLPLLNGPFYSFDDNFQVQDDCYNYSVQYYPKWKPSLAKEWLMDLQGKCLLWVPVEWRGCDVEWFPDILTIKCQSQDDNLVVIKLQHHEK